VTLDKEGSGDGEVVAVTLESASTKWARWSSGSQDTERRSSWKLELNIRDS